VYRKQCEDETSRVKTLLQARHVYDSVAQMINELTTACTR